MKTTVSINPDKKLLKERAGEIKSAAGPDAPLVKHLNDRANIPLKMNWVEPHWPRGRR